MSAQQAQYGMPDHRLQTTDASEEHNGPQRHDHESMARVSAPTCNGTANQIQDPAGKSKHNDKWAFNGRLSGRCHGLQEGEASRGDNKGG